MLYVRKSGFVIARFNCLTSSISLQIFPLDGFSYIKVETSLIMGAFLFQSVESRNWPNGVPTDLYLCLQK